MCAFRFRMGMNMVKIVKEMTPKQALNHAIKYGNKLTPEQMASLIDVFKDNGDYAIKFALHTRWPFPEGEDAIARDANNSYSYAVGVLRRRFEKGEDAIAQEPGLSVSYAVNVLKGNRFIAGEPTIAKNGHTAADYVERVLKRDFPEAEDAIAKYGSASFQYAEALGKAFPAGEAEIAKDTYHSIIYALNILKGRFELGEPAIFKSAYAALLYALAFGIKDLPPKVVDKIASQSQTAYLYATFVIGGRFKAGENTMYNAGKYKKDWYMYHRFLESGGTDPSEALYRLVRLRDGVECGDEFSFSGISEVEKIIATSAIESYTYAYETCERFELGEPAMKKVPLIWKKYQEMLKVQGEKEKKAAENDEGDEYEFEADECDDGDEE